MAPGIDYELALHDQGKHLPAGIDEAGRGCWAGPVVAAAVILRPDALHTSLLRAAVDDSKQLSAPQRDQALALVQQYALGVGVGMVPAYIIDAYGILAATRLAMTTALLQLPLLPDTLLIDALPLPALPFPQQAIIRGDAICLSIAAASIVAKVTRDRLMHSADRCFPLYGFARHKGYGTAVHAHALDQYGPCPLHRRTFRPLLERMVDIE